MKIIGCDFHPSFQQIAMVDMQTGEYTERRLTPEEARQFYAELEGPVLVGMEACGNTLWFERLLASLGMEMWLGDAGKIRAMEVRKQKTDRRDAQLLLQLLLEERFPRVSVPTPEQRDVRQLLLHRHKLVCMRRQVKNELQHLALIRECSRNASCGARRDANGWKRCRWKAGRSSGARIRWSCWTS